jgi:hypothetical protein
MNQGTHQTRSPSNPGQSKTFFATLKKELVDRRSWPSRLELQSAVFEYIEAFYNRHRRHSTLGMLSPVNYGTTPTPAAVTVETTHTKNNNHHQQHQHQVSRKPGEVRQSG